MYDFAIIGGGIVGLATGMAIAQKYPTSRILVLEKESSWAYHQTGHNSGLFSEKLNLSGSHAMHLFQQRLLLLKLGKRLLKRLKFVSCPCLPALIADIGDWGYGGWNFV